MPFLKKINENTFNLSIHVKPNSRKQNIVQENDKLFISLKSPPIKGKANKELLKLIKNKLKIPNIEIYLLSGKQYPDKIIQIVFNNQLINNTDFLKRLFK